MSRHSVADAKNQLPRLINRALKGEDVVITRHGEPVVSLRPLAPAPEPVGPDDIQWLEAHLVQRRRKGGDAGRLVEKLRDAEWRYAGSEASAPRAHPARTSREIAGERDAAARLPSPQNPKARSRRSRARSDPNP